MKQVVWGSVLMLVTAWSQLQAAAPKPACTVRQVTIEHGSDAIHTVRRLGVDRHEFMAWYNHAGRDARRSLRRLRPGTQLDICLRDNGEMVSLQPSESRTQAAHRLAIGDRRFAAVSGSVWSSSREVSGFRGIRAAVWSQRQPVPGFAGVRSSALTLVQAGTPARSRAAATVTAMAAVGQVTVRTTQLQSGQLLNRELAHYLRNHLVVAALSDYARNEWHLPARLPKGSRCTMALRPARHGSSRLQLAWLQVDWHGQQHRVYHYVDAKGHQYVVGARGQGYRVVVPAQPVHYTRISSGWGWRIQPVLGGNEFHHGIDYAAPAGTPIRASMAGVVDISGWHGNYGRLIEIRHSVGISTRYGHLRAFAANIHVGTHVRRGEIIGYVGASGLSTGPHLYYEIWRHGQRINPLTHRDLMVATNLSSSQRQAFDHYIDQQAMR